MKANTLYYESGERVELHDKVELAGEPGTVIALGDALSEWGLKAEEVQHGRMMIEFENHSLVCTRPDEDMVLIGRIDMKTEPNRVPGSD